MANTFLTPDKVVTDSALMLKDQLLVANLANKKYEGEFNGKIGDTLTVNVPTAIAAKELASGGTTTASDVTEVGVDVVVEKHIYQRVDLTAKQLALSVDDFTERVVMPVMSGIINKIEEYALDKLVGGFMRSIDSGVSDNIIGTAGNEPSTHAHILAARKQLTVNKADTTQLVGVITPTAHVSFSQLNIFTSRDFGESRPIALQENTLGRLAGAEWFQTPDAGSAFAPGGAGTLAIDGAATAGALYVHIDGFTADGTVKEGFQFTIAGDTTIYTVSKDATIASNEGDLYIYPALQANASNDAVVTAATAPTQNVLYNPKAFTGVIVAPPAVSENTAMATVGDVSMRIIADTSTSTTSTTWVWDTFVGYKVVNAAHGCVFQG